MKAETLSKTRVVGRSLQHPLAAVDQGTGRLRLTGVLFPLGGGGGGCPRLTTPQGPN